MNSDLRDDVLALARRTDGLRVLDGVEAQVATDGLGARFVEDKAAVWWWESLRPPSVHIAYGDTDGLEALLRLIPKEATVRLAVTDDDPPPWLMVEGRIEALVEMLRNLRIFEFWIAPLDGEWVVFDTHVNSLVVAGGLADAVRDSLR